MRHLHWIWPIALLCCASAFAEAQAPSELTEPGYGRGLDQSPGPYYGQNYGPGYGPDYRPGYGRSYRPGYGRNYRPGYGGGFGRQYERPYRQHGLRITQEVLEEGYVITIDRAGSASSLEIIPRYGRLLVLSRYTKGYRGPATRFARQWGSSSSTITLPRDADLSRMKREEDGERVIVTIPRFRSWR